MGNTYGTPKKSEIRAYFEHCDTTKFSDVKFYTDRQLRIARKVVDEIMKNNQRLIEMMQSSSLPDDDVFVKYWVQKLNEPFFQFESAYNRYIKFNDARRDLVHIFDFTDEQLKKYEYILENPSSYEIPHYLNENEPQYRYNAFVEEFDKYLVEMG